ncbi:TonB-dependent receptor [uncultured Fluviicola sp.]|uniref:TonB-dependent receptor n=1 Tax=uncultured Fluviicola sp. TaxID=463303 RepID=UPI0025F9C779|nr:TonB-dependent receptor [uncultured Fluviicola sp.]
MKLKATLFILLLLNISKLHAQNNGVIQGVARDKNTQELLFDGIVRVIGTDFATKTDENGAYRLEIPTGTYNLTFSYPTYESITKYNIVVTSGNAQIVNFETSETETEIGEVVITNPNATRADATDMVTPLSVQRLTTEEIKSNPGGNYDVSKVVQTLPGVGGASGGAARNDIIIRGGAPNENVYYLDGIEIPVLNHFQTQGSSGGAQGIINVSFIEELKLSSSAFDARYDNALASTFVIKQRQGNNQKFSGNIRASLTESAVTLEGPLGKKADFLAAGRFSYLDLLFTLIDLPIRPRYQDYQLKVSTKLNDKTTLSFIGLGAIDKFKFGATREASPENEYFRRSLPFISQWNYTSGLTLKRLIKKGYINFALSRNMFNNQLDQFKDAQYDNEAFRNFGLQSQEIENKLRIDLNKYVNKWKYSVGISAQYVKYNTDIYSKLNDGIKDSAGNTLTPPLEIRFKSAIEFFKFGAFGQLSRNFFSDRLLISAGVRSDINTFTTDGLNPLSTLSPRLSAAYKITPKFELTGSAGVYYKIPTYTVLGYRNDTNQLVNKSLNYIRSTHYVFGGQFLPNEALRITLEGFYKLYSNYPVSISNGISLANQGQEFGAVGNEAVQSSGKGETYGFEVFVQQKLVKKLFYFVSYTYVRSRFSGIYGILIPSAWDNQHLLSGTMGYKFRKNWQIGAKYRLAGGVPYTPFNLTASQFAYPTTGNGVLDYTSVNSQRLKTYSQLDLRIDKTWNFKATSLAFFIDVQNILATKQQGTPYYTFKRTEDNTGFATTDGQPLKADGSNGIPLLLKNESATVTPTLGIIFEF